ncbi:MAG: cytochrome c biogenesis protein, partial [Verrucomicrobiae bacterium]|nr:cytochrome c biogenesis protein [Verrucomicrobiae bacterium]
MKAGFASLVLVVAVSCVAAERLDFSVLRMLAVQRDGRKKPLDTVANEAALRVTGKQSNAMEFLLSLWLQTRDWQDWAVVSVEHRGLKRRLGLPVERRSFSYRELATDALQALVQQAAGKPAENRSPVEREALVLAHKLQVLSELASPESLLVVPRGSDEKEPWQAIPPDGPIRERFEAVRAAFARGDKRALLAASHKLEAALRALGPDVYPSRRSLAREVHYNRFRPFRKAAWSYGVSFAVLLATWRLHRRLWYWAAVLVFGVGVALHAYGFGLRAMISGRVPITNMYESVVWVSFGAAVFALAFEMMVRGRYCLAAVAPVAAVMLFLADLFPAVLDPSIGPLVPVLRSNFWLAVHVPAVTLGYSAFAVAMALGHVALGFHVLRPQAADTIARLEHFVYRAMQAGVLLLAAGTILGLSLIHI